MGLVVPVCGGIMGRVEFVAAKLASTAQDEEIGVTLHDCAVAFVEDDPLENMN